MLLELAVNSNNDVAQIVIVYAIGIVTSVFIERFLCPRPSLIRPIEAWYVHIGILCIPYAFFVLLGGRPWCAMVVTLTIFSVLIFINNTKQKK